MTDLAEQEVRELRHINMTLRRLFEAMTGRAYVPEPGPMDYQREYGQQAAMLAMEQRS